MNMNDQQIARQHHDTFEGMRQFDASGNEYWLARQLAKVLDYSEYRHFLPVVERAREACRTSGQVEADHFEDVLGMVEIGSGAKREVEDVRLSRYACYLIVQSGDPSKLGIANGQTYFAIQLGTRDEEAEVAAAEQPIGIAIEIESDATLGYASIQNSVPVVRSLRLT